MTDQDKSPREFWIYKLDKEYQAQVFNKPLQCEEIEGVGLRYLNPYDNIWHEYKIVIHVIEYSAYEEARANWEHFADLSKEHYQDLQAERAKNQRLVEALKSFKCDCTIAERLSGHKTLCSQPYIDEALAANSEEKL